MNDIAARVAKRKLQGLPDLPIRYYTDYPDVYEWYWGGEKVFDEGYYQIVYNRNEFAKKFKLKRACSNPPKYIRIMIDRNQGGNLFDHTEVYISSDRQYVLLNSPYDTYYSFKTIGSELEDMGWFKWHDLYSKNANTYVQIVEMK